MNRRRQLLVALGGTVLVSSRAARAQAPEKVRRIGLLSPYPPSDSAPWHQAFRAGLRDLGWAEGKNISIEYAEGRLDRLPDLAADLVRLKVEVIVASATPAAVAARKLTTAIPIVMAAGADPVALGLVESLARPGGNVTGLSQLSIELGGKRLELLKEVVPGLSRVAVLLNPQSGSGSSELIWKEIHHSARQLGIQLHSLEVRSPTEFDQAFEDATRVRAGALFIIAHPVFTTNMKRIADLAAKRRLPAISQVSEFADAGGLVSYGPDRADMFRRAAAFVDKILKGAKPADLPIEQPIKFELVLNLKTAKALGITVPQSVRFRADRVIE